MNNSRTELLNNLREMDEYEFEKLVADVWSERGWSTTVTTGSNDRGIDVIAEKHNPFSQKQLIQAKRYSSGNKVGSPEIQQYSSLRQQESDVDAIIVISTSSFSKQAQRTAEDLNVKTINGDEFAKLITNVIGEKYSTITEASDKNRISCPNCNQELYGGSRRADALHFAKCGKPSTKPTGMKEASWKNTLSKIEKLQKKSIECPNCDKNFYGKEREWYNIVKHFRNCDFPSDKLSGISDKDWSKIVGKKKQYESNSEDDVICPNCGEGIYKHDWFENAQHFKICDEPSAKPSGMSDEAWSKALNE